jgi:hypothetical protein
MSDEGRATTTPTPWVLDVSVLTAIASADPEVTYLVIALDGRGHPLIIPDSSHITFPARVCG